VGSYQDRDDILLRLGFASYQQYLNSELWRLIKSRAFKVHGTKCKVCGKETTTLHHKNYEWEVLSGKTVKGLVPLCVECHYHIEFYQGQKCSLSQANNRLAMYLGRKQSLKHKKVIAASTKTRKNRPKKRRKFDDIQSVYARKNLTEYEIQYRQTTDDNEKHDIRLSVRRQFGSFPKKFLYPEQIHFIKLCCDISEQEKQIGGGNGVTHTLGCGSCGCVWDTTYLKKYAECPECGRFGSRLYGARHKPVTKKQYGRHVSTEVQQKNTLVQQQFRQNILAEKQNTRPGACPLKQFLKKKET